MKILSHHTLFALGVSVVAATSASSTSITHDFGILNFKTETAQSAWGSGTASEISGSNEFTQSVDAELDVGLIENPQIPNPEYLAQQTAYQSYLGAVATYNNVALPAYNKAKEIYDDAWSTYNAARATYNSLSKAYNDAVSAFDKCKKDNPIGFLCDALADAIPKAPTAPSTPSVPLPSAPTFPALVSPPTAPETIGTGRTGVAANFKSEGEIGIGFEYEATAGSVTPELDMAATLTAPESVAAGEVFSLSSTNNLQSGFINAKSPGITASLDGILDVKLDAGGEACAAGACASGRTTLVDVDERIELISLNNTEVKFLDGIIDRIDPNDDLKLKLSFPIADVNTQLWKGNPGPNQSPVFVSVNGVNVAPGFASSQTPLPPYIELASGRVSFPNLDFEEGTPDVQSLSASGSGRIADINFDLDGIANLVNPGLPAGGASVSFGPDALNAAATLDVFDAKAGPTIDLLQQFDLMTALNVHFAFDNAVDVYEWQNLEVDVGGSTFILPFLTNLGPMTEWSGAWNSLPHLALSQTTMVTPTFSLDASLFSRLALQFGLELDVILGSGSINTGPLTGAFGPLVDFNIPEFTPDWGQIDIFSDTFDFLGFNSVVGSAFSIGVNGTPGVPPGTPSAVPLPTSMALLPIGLGAFAMLRRRKKLAV